MQIEVIRNIAGLSLFYSLIGIFLFFVYWNALYFILTRKYDRILFKKPYFNANELGVYSAWPFSLVKATAYILLITNSSISKKRFKELKEPVSESGLIWLLCHIWKVSLLIIVCMFAIGMIWGGLDMLIFDK